MSRQRKGEANMVHYVGLALVVAVLAFLIWWLFGAQIAKLFGG